MGPFKNMSTAAEKAKAIIAAIDLGGDKDLTQQELVSFFDNLTKALGGDAPTRPSEEEAAELIASMGVDGHLKADAFETFLVGFLAALDQSGGSTPKALAAYGQVEEWEGRDGDMYDAVHAMRSRIVQSGSFSGEAGVLGAILFEMTMDREFD